MSWLDVAGIQRFFYEVKRFDFQQFPRRHPHNRYANRGGGIVFLHVAGKAFAPSMPAICPNSAFDFQPYTPTIRFEVVIYSPLSRWVKPVFRRRLRKSELYASVWEKVDSIWFRLPGDFTGRLFFSESGQLFGCPFCRSHCSVSFSCSTIRHPSASYLRRYDRKQSKHSRIGVYRSSTCANLTFPVIGPRLWRTTVRHFGWWHCSMPCNCAPITLVQFYPSLPPSKRLHSGLVKNYCRLAGFSGFQRTAPAWLTYRTPG